MNEQIKFYLPMVDFLYYIVGKNCEICLHDFSDLEHSIVAIKNNKISGRKIGDPAPPIIFDLKSKGQLPQEKININYITQMDDGRPIKAVCYFIHDETTGEALGMLCVNIDDKVLLDLENIVRILKNDQDIPLIDTETSVDTSYLGTIDKTPTFSLMEKEIRDDVKNIIKQHQIVPTSLSTEERHELIALLYQQGLFFKKGAVPIVAELLLISEPTVYRYLQTVKKNDK